MDVKLFYNEIMNTLAKDTNGEPTLVLHAGIKREVRIIGWPIHYIVNLNIDMIGMDANGQPSIVGGLERPVAKYDKWSGEVDYTGDESKMLYANACWVLDRDDGNKMKIMDFLGRGEHDIIDDLEAWKASFLKDPGGMNSSDFSIRVSEDGKRGVAMGLASSIFSDLDKDCFLKEKLKGRLIEARRAHTPEEAAEIKDGTYLSRRYKSGQNSDRLKLVLEALYDISRDQNPNPVIKQQLLSEYNQITGKKHPGFWG